ncbi:hypothetical protein POX_e06255 [Penicillium oxalicum]|uniref:hypothetical protein n=1 Tax=Penicillium oxalicum TaxID=69781 RepID=UPI0020B8ABC8|nr:hypothetical protein POX_e06255 [Penicillium oxalicum]KAI2788242.1 hypothetical protein POX_e06255 [Penicillium oxalicum]
MDTSQRVAAQNRFEPLDIAAKNTTNILTHRNIRHGFIGGYATSLLGGSRMTIDIDIIVDEDPRDVRNLLLSAHSGFRLSDCAKRVFEVAEGQSVEVELLQGGSRSLKLPDASTVSILTIAGNHQQGRLTDEQSLFLVVFQVR